MFDNTGTSKLFLFQKLVVINMKMVFNLVVQTHQMDNSILTNLDVKDF